MNSSTHSVTVEPWKRSLLIVCGMALLARALYTCTVFDLTAEHYWEYGEIAKNLHLGKGYSLFWHNGSVVTHLSSPSSTSYPSAHMPPAYVVFLFPFFFVDNVVLRNALIVVFQSLIACSAVVLMYRWMLMHFPARTALLAALLAALLPEFVYAAGSMTPTVVFHAGFLANLPLLYSFSLETSSLRRAVYAALGCAGLIYLRSEFALFCVVFLASVLVQKHYRSAAAFFAVLALSFLPWQVRNAVDLHAFIPLTTNFGQNLYRGHNSLELGAWADEAMWREASAIPGGPRFELELNRLYLNRAIDFMLKHPVQEIENSFVKLAHFWLWNPSDVRSGRLLYRIPWVFLLLFAAVGIRQVHFWRDHWPVALFLAASTATAVLFFSLPRYQTMMKIALLPFAAHGMMLVWDRLRTTSSNAPEH